MSSIRWKRYYKMSAAAISSSSKILRSRRQLRTSWQASTSTRSSITTLDSTQIDTWRILEVNRNLANSLIARHGQNELGQMQKTNTIKLQEQLQEPISIIQRLLLSWLKISYILQILAQSQEIWWKRAWQQVAPRREWPVPIQQKQFSIGWLRTQNWDRGIKKSSFRKRICMKKSISSGRSGPRNLAFVVIMPTRNQTSWRQKSSGHQS